MRRILLGLFVIIILTIGIVGYTELNNKPNEVIEDSNHSTEIQLYLFISGCKILLYWKTYADREIPCFFSRKKRKAHYNSAFLFVNASG